MNKKAVEKQKDPRRAFNHRPPWSVVQESGGRVDGAEEMQGNGDQVSGKVTVRQDGGSVGAFLNNRQQGATPV